MGQNWSASCVGKQQSAKVSPQDCVIAHATPRILWVCVSAGGVQLGVISAHAPHSGNENQDIIDWWREFEGVIEMAKARSRYVLVCVDANARLGAADCVSVGGAFPQSENLGGELMKRTMRSSGLVAPATWESALQPGTRRQDSHTWASASDHPARLDHVLAQRELLPHVHNYRTVHHIDVMSTNDDHVLVAMRVALVKGKGVERSSSRRQLT